MTEPTVQREVLVKAPIDVVWRTITEPEQITGWFADRVDIDVRPGGAGTLVFNPDSEPVIAPLVVNAVDEPNRFSFWWSHAEGAEPALGTSVLVEFTLVAEAVDRTRVRVTETGVDALGWPDDQKTAYVDDHHKGWEFHLDRLQVLLSGTADAPPR